MLVDIWYTAIKCKVIIWSALISSDTKLWALLTRTFYAELSTFLRHKQIIYKTIL